MPGAIAGNGAETRHRELTAPGIKKMAPAPGAGAIFPASAIGADAGCVASAALPFLAVKPKNVTVPYVVCSRLLPFVAKNDVAAWW